MNFFRKYLRTEFVKNVFTLSLGTFIAQLIPLFLYPFLSRIYNPEDFAVFALYFSIISVLDVVSTGRYELTVINPKDDADSINIVAGAFIYGLLFSILSLLFFFFFGEWLCNILNNNNLIKWIYFIPLSLLFVSISKVLSNWLIRKKAFRQSSINKISQKSTEGTVSLSFGVLKLYNGLILGDIFGKIILTVVSFYQSLKCGLNLTQVSRRRIKANLILYKNFPIYNSIPALLNSFSTLLPVFIISSFYNETTTGYFNFSRQILAIPLSLISVSVSQVLFQQIAEKRNSGMPIFNDLKSLIKQLSILSILFVIVFVIAAPLIFKIIFGNKWELSGEFTQILVFSYAIQFIVSPLSIIFLALNKIKVLSYWQIFYFILMSSLTFFHFLPISKFLLLLTIFDIISYILYFYLILKEAKQFDSSITN